MSKAVYIGIDDIAVKIKKMYVGVDGVARKVKKGYVGVDGVARQFFSADQLIYTGEYSVSEVEKDGVAYNLYRLITSGMLTLFDHGAVWLCGGGAGGHSATSSASGGGGGGGYVSSADEISAGEYAVVIGSGGMPNVAGGKTTVAGLTALGGKAGSVTYNGGAGGSGGGRGSHISYSYTDTPSYNDGSDGAGAGISTYPLSMSDLKAHCAGGAGGRDELVYLQLSSTSAKAYSGGYGNGGTNGSNGGVKIGNNTSSGTGGEYGGGNGGLGRGGSGYAATFYGGGGGGGGRYCNKSGMDELGSSTPVYGSGGNGYQGVVYILMKK